MMTLKTRTSLFLVPIVLCTMGIGTLFFAGCEKRGDAEKAPAADPTSPAVYMKDAEFRKGLDERNAAQAKLVSARAKLIAKMDEMAKACSNDQAKIVRMPGWGALQKQVIELNEKYEQGRREILEYTRKRIAPKRDKGVAPSKEISK